MTKFTFLAYLYQSLTKNFLLLLGLRVSQFNGDKSVATSDPTQKTITNFIASEDANRNCSFTDVADHDFVSDPETDNSIDRRQTHHIDCRYRFDNNHSLDVDNYSCSVWKNDTVEEVFPCLPLILLSS